MKCVLLNKGKGPLSWALKNMSIVTYVLTQFCSWSFFLDTHLNAVIESVDQILFLDRFYFISIHFTLLASLLKIQTNPSLQFGTREYLKFE